MTQEAQPQKKRLRTAALNKETGGKLVDLARDCRLTVADFFDREFGAVIDQKHRKMLEAKLLGSQPQPAISGA